MYVTKFNNLLADLNIQEITVQVGQEFDPKIMEPFETVKDPSKPDNSVATILKPGYKLYDHILKPVLVKVIKNN
ncbi:MAG: nucleotide exchange factor GrpE [Mycoplasmoidaceae bacterium]|nr:nucleotide exchange factor GrpE [Mycoplasmoidaceae bacterium]